MLERAKLAAIGIVSTFDCDPTRSQSQSTRSIVPRKRRDKKTEEGRGQRKRGWIRDKKKERREKKLAEWNEREKKDGFEEEKIKSE